MSARYQPGEIVDVTIRGARVEAESFDDGHAVQIALPDDWHWWLPLTAAVTVSRRAPAEWPPSIGDLWLDVHGGKWFCRYHDAEPALASETGGVDDPQWVLGEYGPMTLLYREGWSPAPAADVDQAAEPDERPTVERLAAGLRELADWLLDHPDLPLSPWDSALRFSTGANWGGGPEEQIERIQAWASLLGVEVRRHEQGPGQIGMNVKRSFSAVEIGISCIVPEVFVSQPAEPECAELDDADAADGPSAACLLVVKHGGGECSDGGDYELVYRDGSDHVVNRERICRRHGEDALSRREAGGDIRCTLDPATLDDPAAADAHSIAATDPGEAPPGYQPTEGARLRHVEQPEHVITLSRRSASAYPEEAADGWLYTVESDIDSLYYWISDGDLAGQYEPLPACPAHGQHPHTGMRCLDCPECGALGKPAEPDTEGDLIAPGDSGSGLAS